RVSRFDIAIRSVVAISRRAVVGGTCRFRHRSAVVTRVVLIVRVGAERTRFPRQTVFRVVDEGGAMADVARDRLRLSARRRTYFLVVLDVANAVADAVVTIFAE